MATDGNDDDDDGARFLPDRKPRGRLRVRLLSRVIARKNAKLNFFPPFATRMPNGAATGETNERNEMEDVGSLDGCWSDKTSTLRDLRVEEHLPRGKVSPAVNGCRLKKRAFHETLMTRP